MLRSRFCFEVKVILILLKDQSDWNITFAYSDMWNEDLLFFFFYVWLQTIPS